MTLADKEELFRLLIKGDKRTPEETRLMWVLCARYEVHGQLQAIRGSR